MSVEFVISIVVVTKSCNTVRVVTKVHVPSLLEYNSIDYESGECNKTAVKPLNFHTNRVLNSSPTGHNP